MASKFTPHNIRSLNNMLYLKIAAPIILKIIPAWVIFSKLFPALSNKIHANILIKYMLSY